MPSEKQDPATPDDATAAEAYAERFAKDARAGLTDRGFIRRDFLAGVAHAKAAALGEPGGPKSLTALWRSRGWRVGTEENASREPAERWTCEVMDGSEEKALPRGLGYVCGYGATIEAAVADAEWKLLTEIAEASDEYMKAVPRYAQRDIESLGGFYMAHLDAMTREKLHDKGAIAAELAYRDERVSRLAAEAERIREALAWYADDENYVEQMPDINSLDGYVPVEWDAGSRARSALSPAEPQPTEKP